MVYTKKHPALLIMGIIFLALAATIGSGMGAGFIKYLGIKGLVGEINTIGYTFGAVGVVVGLWHLFGSHKEGSADYYLSAVAGGIFILLVAMGVRWFVSP